MLTRLVVDLVFVCVILVWIVYNYFSLHSMTSWEFITALMLNYFGARFLIYTDVQLALIQVDMEQTDE